jgi:hypothetical protein
MIINTPDGRPDWWPIALRSPRLTIYELRPHANRACRRATPSLHYIPPDSESRKTTITTWSNTAATGLSSWPSATLSLSPFRAGQSHVTNNPSCTNSTPAVLPLKVPPQGRRPSFGKGANGLLIRITAHAGLLRTGPQ